MTSCITTGLQIGGLPPIDFIPMIYLILFLLIAFSFLRFLRFREKKKNLPAILALVVCVVVIVFLVIFFIIDMSAGRCPSPLYITSEDIDNLKYIQPEKPITRVDFNPGAEIVLSKHSLGCIDLDNPIDKEIRIFFENISYYEPYRKIQLRDCKDFISFSPDRKRAEYLLNEEMSGLMYLCSDNRTIGFMGLDRFSIFTYPKVLQTEGMLSKIRFACSNYP